MAIETARSIVTPAPGLPPSQERVAMGPLQKQPDTIHHVAIAVLNVEEQVAWLRAQGWRFAVAYQDQTFALLEFANVKLSLVIPEQHPPHVAVLCADASRFGALRLHRDGTRSVYFRDPSSNWFEALQLDQ
jgi:catechol 2,3-dioxygenase-like lactoylglutathione lyase family enzyme